MAHSHRGLSVSPGLPGLTIRRLLTGVAIIGALVLYHPIAQAQGNDQAAGASSEEPPPPPPPPDTDTGGEPPPSPDEGGPDTAAQEVTPLQPGEAIVTRFSNTTEQQDESGKPQTVIDLNGISASIIDIRRPGDPPSGQHWIDEPQRMPIVAGEVGQVFGVAIDDAETPGIFLSATAAFGLHRVKTGSSGTDWMPGMWGPDAGPGTIYRLDADNGFIANPFIEVTLNGRPNSGASLGNIAYDRQHKQLFVSDLETGMIHRIDAGTGKDLSHYDHGAMGRTRFLDAWTNQNQSLPPVTFDPKTSAQIDSCSGDFSKTPECWNIADFRRRIWGLGVRQDPNGGTRLYYSVWGSDALGNPEWAGAGDDRRNSVWSIGLRDDGDFIPGSARREFFLPAFWPATPDQGDKAGNSDPISDITFPDCGPQNVMVVAERGGMRNLGLDKAAPFAHPHESRVLRYELGGDGVWRPKGRYDVGFYDRHAREGAPYVFANSAGGAAFGYGYDDNGAINASKPDGSLWMTGDSLCSPNGACTSNETGEHDDQSEVHGIQGSPADGIGPIEARMEGAVQPAAEKSQDFGVLDQSYMVDTDINVDDSGAPIKESLARNDATKIGDIAIYQMCAGAPPLPVVEPPDEGGPPPEEPPDWAAHSVEMSHDKWASTSHDLSRSWHQRNASWHSVERSWHWKGQSWHSINQSWHWRGGSWHELSRSWHWKSQSWHTRDRSWHWREGSWHETGQSWHARNFSFHAKIYSWHSKGQSWHLKNRSYHDKSRSWGNDHVKGRSWGGGEPQHVKGRSFHVKGQSWGGNGGGDNGKHVKGRSFHQKGQSWGGGGEPQHVKGKSFHVRGQSWGGNQGGGDQGQHITGRSYHQKGRTWGGGEPQHSKKESRQQPPGGDNGGQPEHSKKESRQTGGGGQTGGGNGGGQPQHSKKESRQQTGGGNTGGQTGGGEPQHNKKLSRQQTGGGNTGGQTGGGQTGGGGQPQHNKKLSRQQTGGGQTGGGQIGGGQTGGEPVHNRKLSRQQSGGGFTGGGTTGGGQTGGGGMPVHTRAMSRQQSGGGLGGNSQIQIPQQQGIGQGSSGQSAPPVLVHRKKDSLQSGQ